MVLELARLLLLHVQDPSALLRQVFEGAAGAGLPRRTSSPMRRW